MNERLKHIMEWTTRFRPWFEERGIGRKEVFLAAICLILMAVIYIFSKNAEKPKDLGITTRDGEFKRTHVLGDPYASNGRANQVTNRSKDYKENQKLLDRVTVLDAKLAEMQAKIENIGTTPVAAASAETTPPAVVPQIPLMTQAPSSSHGNEFSQPNLMGQKRNYRRILTGDESEPRNLNLPKGPELLTFPVPDTDKKNHPEIVLPVGSYVKAKLLTGVEAPEGNPYPVLMQLDFASIIPNHKNLDLRGCFMIAKAQGDLSTERVQMQATKLSCVSRGGRMFERDINGFVADGKDNSFAVIGSVNTKQDRVAVMAFLSSVVEGVGRTIQMAQTTEQTAADGSSRKILTGNQGKYIGAGGASDAAGMVAQWYLKQAQNLLPTINVGSGQDVWVVMNESVELPQEYFKKITQGENHGKDYSIVHRLFD